MRTNDKEVAARWDRLLVPFKGHLNMRSSIARGALALLSVAAITGCQSGSTWSPTWWNPFHTTPATTSSNSSVAAAPARPSSLASSSPSGYGSGTTANPYSPYSSTLHPVTAPRRIPMEAAAMARLPRVRTPVRSHPTGRAVHYPGSYNSATPSSYSATPGGTTANPYANYGNTTPSTPAGSAGGQYQALAANPYAPSSSAASTYPQTATPYGASTPGAATPAGGTPPCTGNSCPVPGSSRHRPAMQLRKAGMERRRGTSAAPSARRMAARCRITVPRQRPATARARHPATARAQRPATAPARTPSYGSGTTLRAMAAAARSGQLRRPGRRQQHGRHRRRQARPVRTAIRSGRLRLPEAMTVMATATAMVRLPLEQLPRPRRPTRLPTRAVRLPAARRAACPRAAILIRPPPVRIYSPPATSTSAPNATSPYPSSGAAPASSDSGEPAYRPGSTRNSGDFSPRSISSLSPSSLGSNSSSSGVVPAGYVQTSDARN